MFTSSLLVGPFAVLNFVLTPKETKAFISLGTIKAVN